MKTFVVIEKASKLKTIGSWAKCIESCKKENDASADVSLRIAQVRAGSNDAKVIIEITKDLLRFLEPDERYIVELIELKYRRAYG